MSYYSEAIAKHMYTHLATEGKEEYQKFFRSALKKFNIKSPAELDDSKKKEFFNYIEKNYKAKNEDLVGEGVLKENPAVIATAARMAIQNAQGKKVSVNTARQKDYSKKDPSAHKKAKSIFDKIKDKFKKKEKPKKKEAPKSQSKSAAQKYADLYGGGAKVESTKEYGKTLDKMASDRKIKNISKKDRELLARLAQMMKTANEGKLSSKIRKAILVAIGMSGNMTGAVKKIEKMAKGLSDDPKVMAALRIANENINENGRAIMKSISRASKGAIATGGGYAPYTKMGRNSWKQKKTGTKSHDDGIFDAIGTFKDFKIKEALDPYKDFDGSPKEDYNLNLGAFVDEYQKFLKFMKKHKEVPDKNKREWALAIRKKVGQGMFNGHIHGFEDVSDLLSMGDKFRNLKEGTLNELDWNHDMSRMASEIDKVMKMAGIKVKKHVPYKRANMGGDSALYGAFISTKDNSGDEVILPIEVDKKGIVRYAGGPSKWHPLEKIGMLNMSHAKPDDYLKFKTYARTKSYLKQFKEMPGFGQSSISRKK